MPRSARNDTESPGHDSFLDIVANMVGILIILVMVVGVRTFRDNEKGAARGMSTAYVYELDGIYAAHLGDVGHLLDQDTIREIGHVDIVCLGIGPQLSTRSWNSCSE